jgi:hypothetical protein
VSSVSGNTRPHLVEQAETRNDAVIKGDELGLCQPVDIDLHWIPMLRAKDDFHPAVFPD